MRFQGDYFKMGYIPIALGRLFSPINIKCLDNFQSQSIIHYENEEKRLIKINLCKNDF